jgi:hypothetical protein
MRRTLALAATIAALVPATASATPWTGKTRVGVGLRLSAVGLESSADPQNHADLGGGGLQFRVRLSPIWGLEMSAEKVHAEQANGGYVRDWRPLTLTVLAHLRPESDWDWYLLLGVGTGRDDVEYRRIDGSTRTAAFRRTHLHLGAGLERRLGDFGLGAELRAVATKRSDDSLDGPAYINSESPVASESSGGQLTITGTYYF